jgi:hypothetical protein
MSSPDKLPDDEVWEALLDVAQRDEAQRLEGLSSEERDREVAAAGRDPAAERARGEELAARLLGERAGVAVGVGVEVEGSRSGSRSGSEVGRVVPLAPRRASRTLLWLIAAAVGLLAVVLVLEHRELMAWHDKGPEKILPDPSPPREVTAQERAEKLRDEAEVACQGALWGTCTYRLDDAANLDPAGEASPRVQGLRANILRHTTVDRTKREKPVGPPH